MSSSFTVVEYFDCVASLLDGKLLVVPTGASGVYEIKESGQPTFSFTPQNLAHHRGVSLEKFAPNIPLFRTGHTYAHRRADRLFVAWDATKQRVVYLACELKSLSTSGAWTQLQATLAFARYVDSLVRVNKSLPHPTVFAATTIRTPPMVLKSFNPANFALKWTLHQKECPLRVLHAMHDRATMPFRLRDAIASLP